MNVFSLPGRRLWLAMVLVLMAAGARAQALDWRMLEVFTPTVNSTAQTGYNAYLVTATVADSSGNLYQTGYFNGKVNFGSDTLVSAGKYDMFIAKWNPTTARFLWAVRAGGVDDDISGALAVTGNSIFITCAIGATAAQFGTITLPSTGARNSFIAKLNSVGQFIWVQSLTTLSTPYVWSMIAHGSSLYLAGDAIGSTSTSSHAIVTKLTDTGLGATVRWTQRTSDGNYIIGRGLAVVGTNVYLSGEFTSPTMTLGTITLTKAGTTSNDNVFVAKLSDNGSTGSFVWAQRAGGTGETGLGAMAVNGSAIYLTGPFGGSAATGANISNFGTIAVASVGSYDVYVAKLVDAGSSGSFSWVQQAGGTSQDVARSIAVRGADIYVGGTIISSAAVFGNTILASAGYYDAFVAKLTDAGSTAAFDWAMAGGGTDFDDVLTLTLVGNSLYVAGRASAPATFGSQVILGPTLMAASYLATLATAPPLRLISFSPASGPVGTSVTLTCAGTDFTTATAVSFNGTATRRFVVNSPTSITVAVPAGASSGRLTVSTPAGTATSTGSFTVQGALGTAAARLTALALFPNPAHSAFTLTLPPAPSARPVSVCDALGREVRRALLPAQAPTVQLDVAGLPAGVYVVRCGGSMGRLVVE